LKDLGTPLLIHQPSYSILNRWVEEDGLKDTLKELGVGSIAFTPLAQGILTKKYLNGIPASSRAAQGKSLDPDTITPRALASVRALNDLAEARGQTLAQMSLAWVLRDEGITTALIGASKPEQIVDCVGAVERLDFTAQELAMIDEISQEKDVNLWARSSEND
jgi:L-glyceraldehyde 3-phosphate reductase